MTTATIDNKVKQIITNIRNLPTPPIVFHQIQKVLNDPKVSAGQIASILSEDPAISVKVLKLTNSAFYGLSREVESVKQAVVIVGLEAIKNLVISASVLDMFKGKDFDQEFQEKFWRHSLAVGFCGRILAKKIRGKAEIDPDSAFSGGLLHDIGKMIICCYLKDDWATFKDERSKDQDSESYQIEDKLFGYNHSQLGSVLAAEWKLPNRLQEAISYHHNPMENDSEDVIAHLIHISNYIAKKTFYDKDEAFMVGKIDPNVVEFLQLSDEVIEEVSELLKVEYLKAETFMKMAGLS